jgi:hypothetical protein
MFTRLDNIYSNLKSYKNNLRFTETPYHRREADQLYSALSGALNHFGPKMKVISRRLKTFQESPEKYVETVQEAQALLSTQQDRLQLLVFKAKDLFKRVREERRRHKRTIYGSAWMNTDVGSRRHWKPAMGMPVTRLKRKYGDRDDGEFRRGLKRLRA